jgi:hypothetical protein
MTHRSIVLYYYSGKCLENHEYLGVFKLKFEIISGGTSPDVPPVEKFHYKKRDVKPHEIAPLSTQKDWFIPLLS